MSNLLFIPPPSLGWSVFKTPNFNTLTQVSTSGKETRAGLWANPTWDFKLTWEVVRDGNATPSDIDNFMDFFLARRGSFDSFLYSDPTDNAYFGQLVGYGDGVTTTFQLARLLGSGFYESVQTPQAISALYSNGLSLAAMANPIPANPALAQVTLGALGALTNFIKTTWVLTSGESVPSAEVSLATSANKVVQVTQPATPPVDAIGWNVYGSTTTGTEVLQTPAYLPLATTTWTEAATGMAAGTRVVPTASNIWQLSRENVLLNSQNFTQATWLTFSSTTITGNFAVAPDGTTTANKIARLGSGGSYAVGQITQPPAQGDLLQLSAWFQQGTAGVKANLSLIFLNAAGAILARTDGPATTLSASWVRLALSATVPLGATQVQCNIYLSNTASVGDNVVAWGAQLERGTIPTGYLKTVATALAPNGVVTFGSAPAASAVITADYTFYFRVRFKNDLQEFENFLNNLWSAKTVELRSVKL